MSACPALSAGGPSAIADALRAVDCMAGEATASAFARLFGGQGMLTGALTIGLTLYVAIFAIGLLTGRNSLSLSSLTPRMMGLGLTLTFATSWVAYSQVIWTLLAYGPDWIASMLLGIKGSATQAFAQRLDSLFRAVAAAAQEASASAGDAKGTTPVDLLSYAALLLLLGTVGVLVTSRIALAALMAAGPVFLILAIFTGTRGLFEGWLKAAVMFALTPMFAVLIGVGSVAMLNPVVADLATGGIGIEQAATVFVAAAIHCALMAMALKLVTVMISGWRIGAFAERHDALQPAALPEPRQTERGVLGVDRVAADAGIARASDDPRIAAVVSSLSRGTAQRPAPNEAAVILSLPTARTVNTTPQSQAAPAGAPARAAVLGNALRRNAPPLRKEPIA